MYYWWRQGFVPLRMSYHGCFFGDASMIKPFQVVLVLLVLQYRVVDILERIGTMADGLMNKIGSFPIWMQFSMAALG